MTVSEDVLVTISISISKTSNVVVKDVRLDGRSFSLVNTYLGDCYRDTEDLLFSHTVDKQPIFNDFARVLEAYFDSSFGSFYEFVKLNQRKFDPLGVSDYVVDESLIPFAFENGLLESVPSEKIVDHLSSLNSEHNKNLWTVAQ